MKTDLEKYFNSVGEKGSIDRLQAIADANLGERSEAAQRAVNKRIERQMSGAEKVVVQKNIIIWR